MNRQAPATVWHRARSAVTLVCRILGSLPLALVLLVTLAIVLAWATFLEADSGREFAHWYIYASPWFIGLLGLLGLNVLAALVTRLSWKRGQVGLVVTLTGLLLLLTGAILTLLFGIEGEIALQKGQSSDELLMANRSEITIERSTNQGRVSSKFAFDPGATDWPATRSLEFAQREGLGLTVKKFYRHASPQVYWVADEKDFEGPALQLKLLSHQGYTAGEDWLAASLFGGEVVIGPTMYVLLPISIETMVDDFLHPPTENLGEAGVVSVHHAGKLYRFGVDQECEKRIPLGDTGIEVEIVNYLPDARPSRDGTFVSYSSRPKNPVLELKVYLPDQDQPMRQLAFAKRPLLNLDAAYGRECPVRFWYHHPQVSWAPGAMFLQTPTGELYCRTVVNGLIQEPQQVEAGNIISIGGQFSISLEKHIPRARQQVSFTPLAPGQYPPADQDAAAQIEVTVHGERRQIWLTRADEQYGYQSILTPQGVVTLTFDYQRPPLDFSVTLQDFVHTFSPGGSETTRLASSVRLMGPASDASKIHEVSTNAPLACGKFTLYQSGFRELPDGQELSVLTATYDPGRLLKYAGSLIACMGIFTMFFMRAYLFHDIPPLPIHSRTAETISGSTDTESEHAIPQPYGLHRARTESATRVS